jgi:hypothetical protein
VVKKDFVLRPYTTNIPVRNPFALLDLRLLHLGLELFARQLIPINVVALVVRVEKIEYKVAAR